MTTLRHGAGTLLMLLAAASPALSQPPPSAGRIKVASGSAFVVRNRQEIQARVGQVVFEADGLRTGTDGRMGVTLKDETRLSIGPNSEIRLDRFAYAPAEGRLALALRIVRGVAGYVSGRIAKLSPASIRLETPAAIVGVRGTSLAIKVDP